MIRLSAKKKCGPSGQHFFCFCGLLGSRFFGHFHKFDVVDPRGSLALFIQIETNVGGGLFAHFRRSVELKFKAGPLDVSGQRLLEGQEDKVT